MAHQSAAERASILSQSAGTTTQIHSTGSVRLRIAAPVALAICYFATAILGLRFAMVNPSASALWAPAGIALASLILWGNWLWPGIFAGALLANWIVSGAFIPSVGIAIGNSAEAFAGAYLVRRFARGTRAFARVEDTLKFMVLGAGFSTIISATIGVTTLYLTGEALWSNFWWIWLTWWLGDAAGDLVVAPLMILWIAEPLPRWNRAQRTEAALLMIGAVVVAAAIFTGLGPNGGRYPLESLCLPVLLWAAFRFGPREAASLTFLMSAIALAGTLNGFGPFATGDRNASLLILEGFSGLTIVTMISVAVEVARRRHDGESRARLAAIVDTSEDAIVGKDLNGIITSWNAGAANIFGFSSEEAIGRPITMIIPSDRVAEEADILARLRRGEAIRHFETVRRRKNGELLEVSLSISPIRDEEGNIVGASKIARDITEQNRLRREREELLQLEQVAREAAEEASHSKDEFLAMLGHELRNPLQAISLGMKLLEKKSAPNDGLGQVRGVVSRQTAHMGRLVDDLLDVARITRGNIELDREPLDLGKVVSECISALRETGQVDGYTLTAVTPEAWVFGDADRLHQIAGNLIGNALRYTPRGGSIVVSVRQRSDQVVLRVQDSGMGIEPSLLPRVFEPFIRGNLGSDRAPGGLGIGLTMVSRLTELHGGKVEAFSDGPGLGATFEVSLPRLHNENGGIAISISSRENSFRVKRVLIVEDNTDARAVLRSTLQTLGHHIYEAGDGKTAVQMAASVQPDYALIDLGLPGLDGFEVADRIRGDFRCAKIVLIAVTGYGLDEYRKRAFEAGFQGYLIKPIDPEELSELLSG